MATQVECESSAPGSRQRLECEPERVDTGAPPVDEHDRRSGDSTSFENAKSQAALERDHPRADATHSSRIHRRRRQTSPHPRTFHPFARR
jgi:hypothetical protein